MSEETLFHEAAATPPSERAAFLDAACVGQPQLRAGVEALLVAAESPASLLDRPPAGVRPNLDHDTPLDPLGPTILYQPPIEPGLVIAGRYTLIHQIGEGGMAAVWLSQQTEPIKRKVALKLIKASMNSKALLSRFEQERQALALMDHPNIARVLDGGLTPDGRPFFVMDLVNGLALNRFCDQARMTLRQRLELFVPICQAVQHAHQKGIIHRDLKPANILVTTQDGKPVPKVIDFGLAKATAGSLIQELPPTQHGTMLGTLEYMAPEQSGCDGVDIDTRADIYALGVILYELLTGLRPMDSDRLRETAWPEMIRILREEEPSRPSTRLSLNESLPSLASLRRTEPRRLLASLHGELDWVVMKCLEKQRDHRYETANGLARDIQRYLADEPVEARPPSTRYRLGKFLRRNKGPVLSASLVLLALIVGMIVGIVATTLGMLHARQQSIEAELGMLHAQQQNIEAELDAKRARDRAVQAMDAMTLSLMGDPLIAQKEISAEPKKFMTEMLSYYREFAGEKADGEEARARTAAAAYRLGHIEYRLGRKEEAKVAFRQASDSYEELIAEFPAKDEYRESLSRSHNSLGEILADQGNQAEAEQQYREALELLKKLSADYPTVPRYRQYLAKTYHNLGALLKDLGKHVGAEKQFRQSLSIQEKLAAESPTVPEYRNDLAASYNNLGAVLVRLNRPAEAEQQYRKALDLMKNLTTDFPDVPQYQIQLGGSYGNFGHLVQANKRPSESLIWYDKAIHTLTVLLQGHPQLVEAKESLRKSHWGRAVAYTSLEKFVESLKDWDKVIELSPEAEQPVLRSTRATARFQAGQLAKAVAEVAELAELTSWKADEWYNFACIFAVAGSKMPDKKQEYADRAMQLLQQAVKGGWKNIDHMKKDGDLDSLRRREDFKKLIQEMERNAVSGTEKQP